MQDLFDRKNLYIVRDPEALSNALWLALMPRRGVDMAGDEWKYYDAKSLSTELFPEITFETEPVLARFEQIAEADADEHTMWLGRNADGSLCLAYKKPQRNSVNPWWSARGKLEWTNDEVLPHLTWESEPVPVKIVAEL